LHGGFANGFATNANAADGNVFVVGNGYGYS
jgi:hypothetical protein